MPLILVTMVDVLISIFSDEVSGELTLKNKSPSTKFSSRFPPVLKSSTFESVSNFTAFVSSRLMYA